VYDFAGEASGALVRVLVLDTETTGLNPAKDKVVELAMLRVSVDLRTGLPVGPVEVYGGLEDPGMPMPEEARAVTGITDEMLRGQQLDDGRIAAMLDGVDLVVAHNAGFDRPFIEARVPQFAQLNWACSFADIDWKHEGRSSAKLGALAMELGLFYDAHRAEMDCHALLAVLIPALPVSGRTEGLNPQGKAEFNGVNGLMKLILAAKAPLYRLQATGAPFDAKDALKARGYRWDGTSKVWHTRLTDDALLEAECQWLKSAVYGGRAAKVQVEALDALVKYSARPGKLGWQEL
jgi:DNA polymerase-3 subunit epsilon